ncbi:unnamed protein product [Dibothriocephalus latus]|uniref:Endonuclease/exonuclease/phosphatase domain-containing protein n=1 Tax=Dibothriocephalus latus TaxID=60516 RepID=A0A3P6QAT5_DIBLA|nr:unnamed protein product [Dibothriocephalus latus]
MAYVRIKGHFTNISVVSVYSPTSVAEQKNKEDVYSQLQEIVERLPRRDLLIVAGDRNGRTGPGGPSNSYLLGRFELGLRTDNEFRHSYKQPTAICSVDFIITFDSIHREFLWRITELNGVSTKLIAMIEAYNLHNTARYLVHSNLFQSFDIRSGAREGGVLSSIQF